MAITILTPLPTIVTSPVTAVEFPALYSEFQWSAAGSGWFLFRTSANELVERDGYIIKSIEPVDYPKDFLVYYEQMLVDQGWVQTDIAGGSDGEWLGFEKDGYFISFGYNSVSREPLKYQAIVQYSITK